IDLIDTSDAYGSNGSNEELVGRALKGRREKYVVATKFGNIRLLGNPEYVKEACDKSLRRLGTDYIDLYFIHRVDETVPIEDTVVQWCGSKNKERSATLEFPKQERRQSAARIMSIPWRRCRPNIRYGRVTSRKKFFRCAMNSASVSSPMPRSVAVSSPARERSPIHARQPIPILPPHAFLPPIP